MTVGPSALAFDTGYPVPKVMEEADLEKVKEDFRAAARRAAEAGFAWAEVHAAHGYLLHQFLSPLSNQRTDAYGGSFANRARFPLEVLKAAREAWPADKPFAVRISGTDWVEGGWDLEQSVGFSRLLKDAGVDLIDCSSGGSSPNAKIPLGPGYQVPFAERIRREAGIATAAVGLITEARQAEAIVSQGKADLVLMAREFLRDPYWPLRHAKTEGGKRIPSPPAQYGRAFS